MPNCPCENESETCVDATAPITRVLNSEDCVEIGFSYDDTSSINHEVNLDGEFVSTVILSPDANQAIEQRGNGIFVQDFAIGADDLICGKCDEGEGFPANLTNHYDGCNGLEVRQCAPRGDCDGDNERLLWAPPPIEWKTFGGSDTGSFKYGSLPTVSAGTTGEIRMRSVPHTNAGGAVASGLTWAVENDHCSPGVFTFQVGSSGGTARFLTAGGGWEVNFFQRIFTISGSGTPSTQNGSHFKLTADRGAGANAHNVGFVVPQARPVTMPIDPGETARFRVEIFMEIVSTGTDAFTIQGAASDLPQLWVQGEFRTVHRRGSTENIGNLSS